MRLVGGGDDDQVQVGGPVEELVGGGDGAHVRELGAGLPLPLRVRGDDRVQGQALGGGDQRGVEDGTREAVADEADAQRGSAGWSTSHASHFRNGVAKVQAPGTMGAWTG